MSCEVPRLVSLGTTSSTGVWSRQIKALDSHLKMPPQRTRLPPSAQPWASHISTARYGNRNSRSLEVPAGIPSCFGPDGKIQLKDIFVAIDGLDPAELKGRGG
jgi:hypothetical protein